MAAVSPIEAGEAPVAVTEHTALLAGTKPSRTPLPVKQLTIIMLIQISEPLASQSIYPYINQLVGELDITGGDVKKVGYYAGMVSIRPTCLSLILNAQPPTQEALFFLTEAISALQWSRASDRVGRKPILLIGSFGTALSIFAFGLSKTFLTLVIRQVNPISDYLILSAVGSRCLCGLLNGNIGVMKSALGDMTDTTNRAEAFVFLPIVWAAGASIGPLIGGSLARPHDRFPNSEFFALKFWLHYPYFLPCLATGSFALFAWFIVLLFFKETVPWKTEKPESALSSASSTFSSVPVDRSEPQQAVGPLSLRQLMTFPVLVSVSNYVCLGFFTVTYAALIPLFCTMPITLGGLGLDPPKIGILLSIYGLATGSFNLLFFARIVRRLGEKKTFQLAMSMPAAIFVMFPVISLIARATSAGEEHRLWWGIYVLLGCVGMLGAVMDLAFGAIFMFVTACAPKSSRGTVNGLAQTTVSISRALGPALVTSLFSFSLQMELLGGYFVYLVFLLLSCGAMILAARLPEEVWDDIE
ncbi:Major facilitator superfamily multidrug-resistance DHA1 sub-family [Mycena chlorophos]|uniref:Major facilitator superfamily multidrug-resistance DHA1 sub-family n=1 Tax=Mycena chlorophos TaxID=658473 RepID=A0A8H6TI65_MYCCL|nr:Major facilitator superfamily multidrug-resistance DHA1 sub-family [Mycena chlorophos]